MISNISPQLGADLRQCFDAVKYNDDWLTKALDTKVAPTPHSERLQKLLAKVQDKTAVNLIGRLFFLGQPVLESDIQSTLSADFVKALLASGLVDSDGKEWKPSAIVIPCEDLLVASDVYQAAESATAFDHVLAVNFPARHLMLFSNRDAADSTLDLCCGSGVQALKAASYSQRVSATDLNARAIQYAHFNAALNGVDNIEWHVGDGIAPVANRRFDRIICNPPFVITPSQRYLYSDNSGELDSFCRELVRSTIKLLRPGGTMQLICEWVQIGNANWADRIREWFNEMECDVWVIKANTQFPKSYAETRSLERPDCEATRTEAALWARYLEERGVTAVHGGLITIVKSEKSSPWFKATELTGTPEVPYGDEVCRRLHNFELTGADQNLKNRRLVVSSQVQMQQSGRWMSSGWGIESIMLSQPNGLASPLAMNSDMFSFVSQINGERTVEELGALLSEMHQLPLEMGISECEKLCRHLLENGYLQPVASSQSRVNIR